MLLWQHSLTNSIVSMKSKFFIVFKHQTILKKMQIKILSFTAMIYWSKC